MAFQLMFDNPLYGDHAPLALRWSSDQLSAIAECLAPLLPDNLTDQMQLAIASIARSIVAEHAISGRRVHYPRGKDPYRLPKRYRDGDRVFTWYYVTGAMDALMSAGLIEHVVGKWNRYGKGFESVAWTTDRLVALVEPLIDIWESRGISKRVETIVLRDRADKTEVEYTETADTIIMREQVRIVNDNLAQLELRHRGHKVDIPIGRRIFNGSFDRGGRFYCHGPSFQNMSAGQRRELELVIDGTAHPTVEIDYSNLHIRMAYSEAGKRIPDGDQYTIHGFDRALVKVAVNTLFNAPTTNSAILAITEELRYAPALRAVGDVKSSNRSPCRALAEQVVAAIRLKHRRIKSHFGSDCGARFQRQDSGMAMDVMTKMIQRTGRCPLPIHDSFLVPDIDADILSQTMIEVAREYGLRLDLKDSRGSQSTFPLPPSRGEAIHHPPFPPFPPFQLEVTTADLRGSDRQIRWDKVSYMTRKEIVDMPGTTSGALASEPIPQCHSPPDSDVIG
jgi:hypothetical protein